MHGTHTSPNPHNNVVADWKIAMDRSEWKMKHGLCVDYEAAFINSPADMDENAAVMP